jgi:hypothetical protein
LILILCNLINRFFGELFGSHRYCGDGQPGVHTNKDQRQESFAGILRYLFHIFQWFEFVYIVRKIHPGNNKRGYLDWKIIILSTGKIFNARSCKIAITCLYFNNNPISRFSEPELVPNVF